MASIDGSLRRVLAVANALGALFIGLGSSVAVHGRHATIVARQGDLLEEYDFIVAGAGTAGLTVGDRLSESGKYTVLVIEYGYLDPSASIEVWTPPDIRRAPADVYSAASRAYNITSVPQVELRNRTTPVAAGCVVGGSSAVNGMIFNRGSSADYDSWVWAAGEEHATEYSKQWGWQNILPSFRKSATLDTPTPEMVENFNITYDASAYSRDGAIHSSYQPYQYPIQQILWKGFTEATTAVHPREHADGNAAGIIWVPNSINMAKQLRSYARNGHYDGEGKAASRPNFHLLPGHRVTHVMTRNKTAQCGSDQIWAAEGVRVAPRDGPMPATAMEVKVKREVIVAAGTMHTPQVLERSGIGDKKILEAAGVEVKVDLPGVGWNLQEHMHYDMSWRHDSGIFPVQSALDTNATFAAEALAQFDKDRTGPYVYRMNSGAFLPLSDISPKSASIATRLSSLDTTSILPADLDPTLVAGHKVMLRALSRLYQSHNAAVLEFPFGSANLTRIVSLKVTSRGTVHISPDDDGSSPTGRGNKEPILDYRTFSNPIDIEVAIEQLKFIRRVMSSPYLVQNLNSTELLPGASVKTDEEIEAWLRDTISTGRAHPVGTARLGPRELGGVLRPDLTVWGTEGLSVADNSVIPITVGAHTSSTAYAIGEKAAVLALERAERGGTEKC